MASTSVVTCHLSSKCEHEMQQLTVRMVAHVVNAIRSRLSYLCAATSSCVTLQDGRARQQSGWGVKAAHTQWRSSLREGRAVDGEDRVRDVKAPESAGHAR